MRPVMAKVLDPVRLIDGSVDLEFIALLNDSLDVWEENKRLAEEAAERRNK